MKKRVLLVILVLAVATGAVWWRKRPRADLNSLTLFGNVDIRQVNLGFRVNGRLAALLHDEGDAVKAGEVLARLDDEPYRNQAASAAAQVASLRARLALREAGNRPQEIAQARALMDAQAVTAANAQKLFQRNEEMLASKGVSQQDRDNADAAYREAEARLKSFRENLSLLEAGYRVEDVAQAKADLQQAEAALAAAQLSVKDSVLSAPSDGVILARAQEAGAILSAGATVFTLSLQNPVWVRVYANEPDLGRLHPGMKVEIRTDTANGKHYEGQIGFISPVAEFTPKAVETPELRTALVYRLRVVVAPADEGLRQGMPVTVTIPTPR